MYIYFVFKGDGYYPIGGWDDNAETYTTLDSAITSAKDLGWGQWSHIVQFDIRTFQTEIIKRFNTDDEWHEGKRKQILREVAVDYMGIIEEWEV